jgi:hypothetical protein
MNRKKLYKKIIYLPVNFYTKSQIILVRMVIAVVRDYQNILITGFIFIFR